MFSGRRNPGRVAYYDYKLSVVKEIVCKWLRKVPAEKFSSYQYTLYYENDEKLYSDPYVKRCFLAKIRGAKNPFEIADLLISLDFSGNALEIFLCSRIALENWRHAKVLIQYVTDEEKAKSLNKVYNDSLDKGLDNVVRYSSDNEPITLTQNKVSPEDILSVPEYPLILSENT